MCGYFLNATSDSPVLMSGYLVDSNGSAGEALVMRTLPLTTLLTKELLFGNGSINFKRVRNTIADAVIVSAANGSTKTVYQHVPPIAQECILSWCVKTIESSYDYGEYSEKVTETHLNTTEGPFPWIGLPYMDSMGGGTELSYLSDIQIAGTTSDGRIFAGYGTDNATAFSVIQALNDIFPAFTSVNGTSSDLVTRFKIYKNGPAFNRYLKYNPWLAPNNISRHMERLAETMTNIVRSAPSKIMLKGNAYSRETYVAVHWEWFTFPFVLLGLTLIFLVSTIIKTSGNGATDTWKNSAMPALIYSLPLDVQKDLSGSRTDGSSSKQGAGKVRIRLLPDCGWRVSRRLGTSPISDEHNMQPG
jgi:hypothetical protein